jgi:hypothetical protein
VASRATGQIQDMTLGRNEVTMLSDPLTGRHN